MSIIQILLEEVHPTKIPPKGVWVGLHWTGVKSKYIGVAHTYKTIEAQSICNGGILSKLPLNELCSMALSKNTLDASIGCAAINSLIKPHGMTGNIEKRLKVIGKGKNVSIIGRFPFNDIIRKIAGKCYILEMNPLDGELPSSAAEEILPKCDLNIITATAIINHTIDGVLKFGSGGINVILGPTTPLSEILFDYGVDILAGVRVNDCTSFARSITQGVKKFGSIEGIEPIYIEHQKGRRI